MTLSQESARTTIAVCTAIYFLDGLIHTILGPLAPEIARSLSLGNAELGPIFSANLIGQCVGLVVFPAIAGRYGHRLTVSLAVLGFGLGQSASALVESGTLLFLVRLVTGVFLGGCLPSCLAMVTQQAPADRRGLSILTLFTGYGLGAAGAGIVAAGFAEIGGWRIAMAAVGALSLALAGGALLWLRDPLEKPDRAASLSATGAPFVLQLLSRRYGTIVLEVQDDQGKTHEWRAETNAPAVLVRRGWTRDVIKPGETITIDGWPARDGKSYLRLRTAHDASGRLVGSAAFDQTDG